MGPIVSALVIACACAAFAQDVYVGAVTCGKCHPKQYSRQSRSHHAQALHPASEAGHFDYLPDGLSKEPSGARFEFRKSERGYAVTVALGQERTEIPIDWIVGANDQGLTFFSRVAGQGFLEHRLSYYKRKAGFDVTAGHRRQSPVTLQQAMGVAVTPAEANRCLGCHSTYVKTTAAGPDFSSVVPGVTCERCHGAGGAHVAAITAGASDRRIRNPGKLPGDELVSMCGECHRNEPPPGTSFDDPIVTRFQPVGLQMSACFQGSNGAINCLTCHDPHENARRGDDRSYNERCLSCHGEQSVKQCGVGKADGCIGCHMPKVSPVPLVSFADHWIRKPAPR